MYNTKEIGLRIKEIRCRMGFKQENFASELGVSHRQLQRLERGENGPSIDFLVFFSEKYHYSLDYLVLGKTNDDKLDAAIDMIDRIMEDMTVLQKKLTGTDRVLQ